MSLPCMFKLDHVTSLANTVFLTKRSLVHIPLHPHSRHTWVYPKTFGPHTGMWGAAASFSWVGAIKHPEIHRKATHNEKLSGPMSAVPRLRSPGLMTCEQSLYVIHLGSYIKFLVRNLQANYPVDNIVSFKQQFLCRYNFRE